MVVALRPETGEAGVVGQSEVFQSLGEEHQKNVVRWALANRARVSEEARAALNNALIGNVSVRGFRESNVPDAPAIMLIQPVRNAALVVDALAHAVLTVWQESRPELRGIVENDDAGHPVEPLASAHPQYSADDVSLMIALTLRDLPERPEDQGEGEEEETALPQVRPQEGGDLRERIFAALNALEEAAALLEPGAAIQEITPSDEDDTQDDDPVAPVDAVDDAEKHYLRDMVEALQRENIQLKAAAKTGKTDFHALILEHEATRETPVSFSSVDLEAQEPDDTTFAPPASAELQEPIMEEQEPEAEEAAVVPVAEVVEQEPEVEEAAVVPAAEVVEQEPEVEEAAVVPVAEIVEQEPEVEEPTVVPVAEIVEQEPEVEEPTVVPVAEVVEQEPEVEEAGVVPVAEVVEQEPEVEEAGVVPVAEVVEQEPDSDETLAAPPDFGDVASVLDFVENRWPNELRLALNNNSDHKLYFDQPNQAYSALEWLATTYRNSRTGEKPVSNLDVSLFTTCGWRYRPFQTDAVPGRYRSDYQTTDNERKYTLNEHIGRGTGRTPGQIRVAFAWDEERKMVVVGYIGRHQRPNAT